jgi:hypothetical protein
VRWSLWRLTSSFRFPIRALGRRLAGRHRKITLYFACSSELPQEADVAYAPRARALATGGGSSRAGAAA